MKSCITTVAIIGCVSAAPQRMRVRDLQGSMSMPSVDPDFAVDPEVDPGFAVDPQPEVDPGFAVDPQPEVDPGFAVDPQPEVDPGFAVDPQPEVDPGFGVDPAETTGEMGVTTLPGDIGVKDFPEMSMSMPPEVPVTLPEPLPEDEVVVDEILWESLSVPAIYEEIYGSSMSMPKEWTPMDAGFVPAETGSGYVEPESDDVPPTAEESDDVTKSSATGAFISGVTSACAVVGALALF